MKIVNNGNVRDIVSSHISISKYILVGQVRKELRF